MFHLNLIHCIYIYIKHYCQVFYITKYWQCYLNNSISIIVILSLLDIVAKRNDSWNLDISIEMFMHIRAIIIIIIIYQYILGKRNLNYQEYILILVQSLFYKHKFQSNFDTIIERIEARHAHLEWRTSNERRNVNSYQLVTNTHACIRESCLTI